MRRVAILALIPGMAMAQPFIEVGVGAAVGGCMYDSRQASIRVAGDTVTAQRGCSRSPLGLVAIGYQFTPELRIQLDHWSSIPDTRDRGMEILSIRYRYTFK